MITTHENSEQATAQANAFNARRSAAERFLRG